MRIADRQVANHGDRAPDDPDTVGREVAQTALDFVKRFT